MGALFDSLCRGPVFVIDDEIGGSDFINELIAQIDQKNLPVFSCASIADARRKLPALLFSNFVILDWRMKTLGAELASGVRMGEASESASEEEVIAFIREVRTICQAPIFVVSKVDKDGIVDKLKSAGVITERRNYVFVEDKKELCTSPGLLVSRIEKWIQGSPHICLYKCWTNEWLSKNTKVFWDLYDSNHDWPAVLYKIFEEDGEDPILALRDTLFQLGLSTFDVSGIAASLVETTSKESSTSIESLKNLYRKLVYIERDIERDIRPGDVFKKGDKYYLNIRPECDTTKRGNEDPEPELYLLEGEPKKIEQVRERYNKRSGLVPLRTEILALLLDGCDVVRFDKKKLSIKKPSEMSDYKKLCRVAPPFITDWRQSFSSFLGRYGVPRYSKEIEEDLFKSKEQPS